MVNTSWLHCITGLTQRTARRVSLRAVHCFAFYDLRLFLHFVSVYKIFPNNLQSVFLGELSCKVRIPCFRCIFQPLIILRITQIPFGCLFVRVQRTLIAFVHSLLCTVKFLHDLFVLRLQLMLQCRAQVLACFIVLQHSVAIQGFLGGLWNEVSAAAFTQCYARFAAIKWSTRNV